VRACIAGAGCSSAIWSSQVSRSTPRVMAHLAPITGEVVHSPTEHLGRGACTIPMRRRARLSRSVEMARNLCRASSRARSMLGWTASKPQHPRDRAGQTVRLHRRSAAIADGYVDGDVSMQSTRRHARRPAEPASKYFAMSSDRLTRAVWRPGYLLAWRRECRRGCELLRAVIVKGASIGVDNVAAVSEAVQRRRTRATEVSTA
jgi:hypothetical protein